MDENLLSVYIDVFVCVCVCVCVLVCVCVCSVFPDHSKPYVEVLANQNTLLRSHDPQGRFFDCWIRNEGSGGCVQRSMYCIDHTPSSVGLSFSMARVMGMASR